MKRERKNQHIVEAIMFILYIFIACNVRLKFGGINPSKAAYLLAKLNNTFNFQINNAARLILVIVTGCDFHWELKHVYPNTSRLGVKI